MALGLMVAESWAGPRAGGRAGGGSPGVSRPAGGNAGGARTRGGAVSPQSPTSRGTARPQGKADSPRFGSRDLGSKGLKGHDKLSHSLEKGVRGRGGSSISPPTQEKLQSFLNLPTQGERPAAGNRAPARQPREESPRQPRGERQSERQADRPANSEERQQTFSERSQQIREDVTNHRADQPEPFSPEWYADHPHAWQYEHPHADAWVAATWGMAAGWVAGVATTPVPYTYGETVVYVEGAPPAEAEASEEAQLAHQLSQTTHTQDPQEWLPLGVYALVQGDETKAQMLMQLSISKSGLITGTYYNVLSDNSQPLAGSLDKQTQKLAWTIADNDHVVFQTDLNSLTQVETPVLVHYGDGETHKMTLVRLPDDA